MIAVAIFLTYTLQFYVPMEIVWKRVRESFSNDNRNVAEYTIRIVLIVSDSFILCSRESQPYSFYSISQCLTVFIAIAIPDIGPFISLIGAVCLSTLGLIFPAIIELVVYWDVPGLGAFKWRLWKNVFLIAFGLFGFVIGTYVSISDILGIE